MAKRSKRIATVEDPTLEAICEGLFRLENEMQAVSLLDRMGKQYVIAKKQDRIDAKKAPTLRLWIKGYGVTKEEAKKGYKGNFALIRVSMEHGRWTLRARKVPMDIKQHPQRQRPSHRHPNWGHPILRSAQKEKEYPSSEHIRMEMLRLHEEFPETSIPGRDKLHLMVYCSTDTPPIHRVTLRIHPLANGNFIMKTEDQNKPDKVPPTPGAKEKSLEDSSGKFTSMIALSRKKKKKRASPMQQARKNSKNADDQQSDIPAE